MSSGSARSPYREDGLNAKANARPPRRKRCDRGLYDVKGSVVLGHRFELRTFSAKQPICRYCRQPRFVVDGAPCAGPRP